MLENVKLVTIVGFQRTLQAPHARLHYRITAVTHCRASCFIGIAASEIVQRDHDFTTILPPWSTPVMIVCRCLMQKRTIIPSASPPCPEVTDARFKPDLAVSIRKGLGNPEAL